MERAGGLSARLRSNVCLLPIGRRGQYCPRDETDEEDVYRNPDRERSRGLGRAVSRLPSRRECSPEV